MTLEERVLVLEKARATSDYNVQVDGSAVGDGVTDDADALQNSILAAVAQNRPVYIPAGAYSVSHPIVIPERCYVRGNGVYGVVGGGTVLVPSPNFDLDWNNKNGIPSGTIPAGVIQASSYAPDPTGQKRWTSAIEDTAVWWHCARVESLLVQNNNKLLVHGFCLFQNGENSRIFNCGAVGCTTGIFVAGGNAPLTLELCHLNGSRASAVHLTNHPYWTWLHADPGRANIFPTTPGRCGGQVRIFGISGDNNVAEFFRVCGGHSLYIQGHKYEEPEQPSDCAIRIETDPFLIGTGAGNSGQMRAKILYTGTVDGGIGTGPNTGQWMDSAVVIENNSDKPEEWPAPYLTIQDSFFAAMNMINDKTVGRKISQEASVVVGREYFV